ncbi:unnamed protein product [Rotaria sp. Silwood2]|nr:unnamed protein product [Rotaria sp. Silwood2]CAF3071912.1 unnamed protein product [Rotaria sp. Silwood2]CAF4542806.1 unnamed protein product [Rotaria sp. Silwood2]CAF4549780.1 unnamed protein product [Rotaria sp. Silwood2]CAF4649149.1 unnamed protein product [Rotaria sp. Silwood2]
MEPTEYNQNDQGFPTNDNTIHMLDQEIDQPSQSMILNNDEQQYSQGDCLEHETFSVNKSVNNINEGSLQSALLDVPVLPSSFDNLPSTIFTSLSYNTVETIITFVPSESCTSSSKEKDQKQKKNFLGFHIKIEEEPKQNIFEDVPKDSTTLIFQNLSTEVHVNEFNIARYLGCGKYGSVDAVKIIRPSYEIDLAVKRIPLITKTEESSVIQTELSIIKEIMNSSTCPYLIDYYGYLIDTVVSALEFLSEKNYFHRDIKPENILVNTQVIFKLSDYGICCKIDEIYSDKYHLMGTIHYLSPELLDMPPDYCSKQSELWALGISLIEIINGQHPYMGSDILDHWILFQRFNPTISNRNFSKNIEDLILSLVKKNVQCRLDSYSKILSMPFIQNIPKESTIDEIKFIESVIEIIQELPVEASEY